MVIDLTFFWSTFFWATFLPIYLYIALAFLLTNAFITGYFGVEKPVSFRDFVDALIWPVSLSILLGVCLRIILDYRWKFFKLFRRK